MALKEKSREAFIMVHEHHLLVCNGRRTVAVKSKGNCSGENVAPTWGGGEQGALGERVFLEWAVAFTSANAHQQAYS